MDPLNIPRDPNEIRALANIDSEYAKVSSTLRPLFSLPSQSRQFISFTREVGQDLNFDPFPSVTCHPLIIPARDGYPLDCLVYRPRSSPIPGIPSNQYSSLPHDPTPNPTPEVYAAALASLKTQTQTQTQNGTPLTPAHSLPLILILHGGGYVFGCPAHGSRPARLLVSSLAGGAIVVCARYRLAPEHPYPCAINDAWDVLRWIAGQFTPEYTAAAEPAGTAFAFAGGRNGGLRAGLSESEGMGRSNWGGVDADMDMNGAGAGTGGATGTGDGIGTGTGSGRGGEGAESGTQWQANGQRRMQAEAQEGGFKFTFTAGAANWNANYNNFDASSSSSSFENPFNNTNGFNNFNNSSPTPTNSTPFLFTSGRRPLFPPPPQPSHPQPQPQQSSQTYPHLHLHPHASKARPQIKSYPRPHPSLYLASPQTHGFLIGGWSSGGSLSLVLSHLARHHNLTPPLTGLWMACSHNLPPHAVPERLKHRYLSREQEECNCDVSLDRETQRLFERCYSGDEGSGLFNGGLWVHRDLGGERNLAVSGVGKSVGGGGLGGRGLGGGDLFDGELGERGLGMRVYAQVTGRDFTRDEMLLLMERFKEEGVEGRVDIYKGLPHVFWVLFPQLRAAKRWKTDLVRGFEWMLRREERGFDGLEGEDGDGDGTGDEKGGMRD